ncbi:alpha/beta hydrolase [Desertivirga arenae]|uniref:alpha/beta hydrolase n=1 Tax=Desertivirga arenae TaxID=2810309 RepID=UPI001A95E688|nr:alpha/beta hydrolase [Pedobacter sp. SYSU D00823]
MYKYLSLLLALTGYLSPLVAQNTSGLTGKPDTSYSTYSAFRNTVRQFPDIKIVKEQKFREVKELRNITYCNLGSRNLKVDAFLPIRKKKAPAILIIHGGGWRTGNRAQHYPLAQHLAKKGFACFTAEYRLSTEALYPAAVYDLKAALRWMKAEGSKYRIDTGRIAVLGFSAGGELAAFIGSTANNLQYEDSSCHANYSTSVQAIVDIDGTLSFVHPESGEGDDSRSTSAGTYWFGYSKKENPALWADASPLAHAKENKAPVLFLNSSVNMMHAGRDDFRRELDKKNIYSEVQTFPEAPHSFILFEPWFKPSVTYIDTFLKKVLTNNPR